MLHWIWLFVLTSVGWMLAYFSWNVRSGMDSGTPQITSHCVLAMSIVLSWDEVGANVYQWLLTSLPQHGSQINIFTSNFIGLLLGLFWVMVPVFVPLLFMNDDGKIALKYFILMRLNSPARSKSGMS